MTSQEIFFRKWDNLAKGSGTNMIGKILRTMRRKSNFSQEQIAKLTGFVRTTISQYESEVNQPDFETIEKIAKICGYEVIFRNKATKEELTSKNIEREEI